MARRGIGGVQMTLAEGGQRLAAKGLAEEIIRIHGRPIPIPPGGDLRFSEKGGTDD